MLNLIPKRSFPFLVADIILIIFSVIAAFLVRFELSIPVRYLINIEGIIALSLLVIIPVFYFSKLYIFTWEFVSTEELISLVKATSFSFLIVTAAFFVLRDHQVFSGFPRSTLFISYFFIFIFCGGIRFAERIYLQISSRKRGGKKEKTLIVGAGGAGEQILRNILSSKNNPYLPVGFIDDNPKKKGMLIHGLEVLGAIDEIPQVVKDYNIDNLIIAFPSAGSEIIKRAEKKAIEAGVMDIKYLPPMDELINSADKIGIGMLHDVDLEDLLDRETAVLDQKPIKEFIREKKFLITGAAGSIGSELSRQVAKFNPQLLVLLDQDETGVFNISEEFKSKSGGSGVLLGAPKIVSVIADIQDKNKIKDIFSKFKPDIVFHVAAYKHVPLMEDYPEEAVKNNIFGTKNLIEVSIGNEVGKFIFISTDKAVNPTSVMGTTKRIGEMMCQAANKKNKTRFISVRFGNVLGSRGSVIPIFKDQISKGGPIKITHKEMRRYFMVTSEACLLVMQAGAMGQGGEVFVFDMGNPVKIMDLAKDLIRRSGFQESEIPIEYMGPRPGEKIIEEILTEEEGTVATKNQKIFMARLLDIDVSKLNFGLKRLEDEIQTGDKESIIKTLKELVPSYNPGKVFSGGR